MSANIPGAVPGNPGTSRTKHLLRNIMIGSGRLPPDYPQLWLERADSERFAALESQWTKQIEAYGDEFQDFAAPFVSHAREIVNRDLGVPTHGNLPLGKRWRLRGLCTPQRRAPPRN